MDREANIALCSRLILLKPPFHSFPPPLSASEQAPGPPHTGLRPAATTENKPGAKSEATKHYIPAAATVLQAAQCGASAQAAHGRHARGRAARSGLFPAFFPTANKP